MTRISRSLLAGTALSLLAPAAFADLSAADVWADWKAYISGFGYEITGEETPTNDGLTINGVTIEMDGDTGAGSFTLDRIVMTEQSDGTVTVDLPAIMPFEIAAANDMGGMTRVSMDYRQTGLDIVASGAPDAMRYDYRAQEITLQSTGFEVNGDILPPSNNSFTVVLEAVSGQTDVTLDGARQYDQNLEARALRYTLSAADEDARSSGDVSGQIQAVTFAGNSSLPLDVIGSNDMDEMLAAGFSATGAFGFAANAMSLSATSPTGADEISLVAGEGTFNVEMDQTGLSYVASQKDLQADALMSQFPLPMQFSVMQSAFSLAVPVRKSETPDDFGLGITLEGFSMSDALWGLFDPSGQLPRDPATVALDLAGKARLLFNFLDPAQATAFTADMQPVELEKLDINRLQVSAVGADLTGTGTFAFDNSQPGPPKPSGAVDLNLSGGNALIDKLVAVGLLPEQQAMGARMMMGLLAVPGEGPDTLKSKIEINDQGHVLANGQRIQ